MSNLVAIVFEGTKTAADVRAAIRQLQHQGLLTVEDAAVVVKDADGTVHVDNETDRAVRWSALGGALLGPLILFTFPVAGIALGAAGGALVGKSLDRDIDKSFTTEVRNALEPDHSALIVLAKDVNRDAVVAALEPYQGTVYTTTLSEEAEDTLRRALR
jgi:uncharacterized membrane protein